MVQSANSPNIQIDATISQGKRASLGQRFDNLPVQIKASLAAVLLMLCLLTVGVNAYLTSARSAIALRMLSDDLISKQLSFTEIGSDVVATHLKIFRHVSWSSNGVSANLLDALHAEIKVDLQDLSTRIEALTTRRDISDEEQIALESLFRNWNALHSQAVDTVDIGQVDPAMETMLMGQTDDMFDDVMTKVRDISNTVASGADSLRSQMSRDAEKTKTLIVIVTALGFGISVIVAGLISRSIVRPIKSITDIMQRLSAGDIDVPITHTDRRDEIGRMAEAIEIFRKNIIDKQVSEQILSDAIEAISEGFSLYDSEDRLVVCNSHYREIFAYGMESVTPGMQFESIIRSAISRGAVDLNGDGEDWVAERLRQHRDPAGPHIQHRADGRWVMVSERLTSEGGTVATYTDISELKAREAELDKAHAQVSVLNEKLRGENLRMEGELDVSRRLQLMVLPTKDELAQINGLDIAAFMEPTLEVGGDYYDVLQKDGRVRIGIGDVTGHGLESGVVMLMTQSIVRTLLTSGETDPVKFLSILNTTLFENVRRMDSDKNLTLCLLEYVNGEARLSGQHEHMIVLRNNGNVEIVDTIDLGFPVGLIEDISEFIGEVTVKLKKGDGIVLFTDGITEAENLDNQQYGLERLTKILQKNCNNTADQIKQVVIEDVYSYIGQQIVYDDITLLVAKRN